MARLARSVGRKLLFGVAGLVSIHDGTWTTDRATAARRWAQLHPNLAEPLSQLLRWGDDQFAGRDDVVAMLAGPAQEIVDQFRESIGVWES